MIKRTLILLIIISVIVVCIAACTNKLADDNNDSDETDKTQQEDSVGEESNKLDIALVMKTLTNPFFIEMEKGARRAESELGINLIVKTGAKETSIEQQISIVEELIAADVDAIVIAPGSSTDLVPVLKQAQDAGIEIVNIDNRLDEAFMDKVGLVNVPFISVDNEDGAYRAAKLLCDRVTEPTKAVIIEGIRGADNAEQRKKGALRAFDENENIELIATETANWKIDEAHDVTSLLFSKHNDIGVVYCANDMMALGALEYLKKSDRDDVLVGGFDALEEALNAIESEDMVVTIDQQADVQGYMGVKYAIDMLNGQELQLETMIDVKVITKENAE